MGEITANKLAPALAQQSQISVFEPVPGLHQRFLIKDTITNRYLAMGTYGVYSTLNFKEAYQFFNYQAAWLGAMLSTKHFRLVYLWPHQYEPKQRV